MTGSLGLTVTDNCQAAPTLWTLADRGPTMREAALDTAGEFMARLAESEAQQRRLVYEANREAKLRAAAEREAVRLAETARSAIRARDHARKELHAAVSGRHGARLAYTTSPHAKQVAKLEARAHAAEASVERERAEAADARGRAAALEAALKTRAANNGLGPRGDVLLELTTLRTRNAELLNALGAADAAASADRRSADASAVDAAERVSERDAARAEAKRVRESGSAAAARRARADAEREKRRADDAERERDVARSTLGDVTAACEQLQASTREAMGRAVEAERARDAAAAAPPAALAALLSEIEALPPPAPPAPPSPRGDDIIYDSALEAVAYAADAAGASPGGRAPTSPRRAALDSHARWAHSRALRAALPRLADLAEALLDDARRHADAARALASALARAERAPPPSPRDEAELGALRRLWRELGAMLPDALASTRASPGSAPMARSELDGAAPRGRAAAGAGADDLEARVSAALDAVGALARGGDAARGRDADALARELAGARRELAAAADLADAQNAMVATLRAELDDQHSASHRASKRSADGDGGTNGRSLAVVSGMRSRSAPAVGFASRPTPSRRPPSYCL